MIKTIWLTWVAAFLLLFQNQCMDFATGIKIELPDKDKKDLLKKHLEDVKKFLVDNSAIGVFQTDKTIFCPALMEKLIKTTGTTSAVLANEAKEVVEEATKWVHANLRKNEGVRINWIYYLSQTLKSSTMALKYLYNSLPKKLEINKPRYLIRFEENKDKDGVYVRIMLHMPFTTEDIVEVAKELEKYNLYFEINMENKFVDAKILELFKNAPADIRQWINPTNFSKDNNSSAINRFEHDINDIDCRPSQLMKENTVVYVHSTQNWSSVVMTFKDSEEKYAHMRTKKNRG